MAVTLQKALPEVGGPNLYLAEVGPINAEGRAATYQLVMPDAAGKLPAWALRKRTGLALAWPVNPHATGESAILDLLNPGGGYAAAVNGARVTCEGYACDQNGRHFRS